ncbi:MAG TPA: DNA polymerase III subunit delta [Acidimicrobiales bacterium]
MSASTASPASITLLVGDEPTVLGDALHTVVHEALAGADRDLALAQLTEDDYRAEDRYELAPLIDAAQTPPFLTEHRVVVGRHLGRFSKADDLAPLLEYLASPLPTTRLVLVWERGQNPRQDRHGTAPKKLVDAVVAAGGSVIDTAIGTGKAADAWLEERLTHAAVKLDRDARALVHTRLGEDRSRVVGLLATLEAAFGPGAKVGVDDVEPFLGEAGSVPPWELTDAIDRGDIPTALDKLTRLLGAGERHPLQVLATLHGHYERMLRLDGEPGLDERSAAKLLGLKGSTFPAKKALTQSKRLGSKKLRTAFALLADADLALRGARAWPPELVMEVLVARLANLSRR